jgi:hypothetical protein
MLRILILTDIRPAGYPANLKARYRISGQSKSWIQDIRPDTGYPAGYPLQAGYRISGRIFKATFKYLVKYETIKNIRCIKGFLFRSYHIAFFTSKQ